MRDFFRPRVRSAVTIGVAAACLLALLPVTLAAGGLNMGLSGDQVSVLTIVTGVSNLVLVVVTLLVALAAYRASTGSPDLTPKLVFPFSPPDGPAFEWEDADADAALQPARDYKQLTGTLELHNASAYAAKNPGVRVKLIDCAVLSDQKGWAPTQFINTFGITEMQWDGGTGEIVHGNWSRTLPTLDLGGLRRLVNGQPCLRITLVADGWGPKTFAFPIGDRSRD